MKGLQGKIGLVCAVALAVGLWAPMASADVLYGYFNVVEQQNSGFGDALHYQFLAEVDTDATAEWAEFTFYNLDLASMGAAPPAPSDSIDAIITQIYWEDIQPLVLDPGTEADDWSGVEFPVDPDNPDVTTWYAPATPPVLPGTNNDTYNFVVAFGSDANNPQPENGIDVGESASFLIRLTDPFDGGTAADAADALIARLLEGTMRLGIHVQGINGGESENDSDSFLTIDWDGGLPPDDPFVPPPVPVPAAAGIGFLGMGLVGAVQGYRRLRR